MVRAMSWRTNRKEATDPEMEMVGACAAVGKGIPLIDGNEFPRDVSFQ